MQYFVGKRFNTFRVPFLMERLSPPSTGMSGPFDQTYLQGLKTIVSYITGKGGYALIDRESPDPKSVNDSLLVRFSPQLHDLQRCYHH